MISEKVKFQIRALLMLRAQLDKAGQPPEHFIFWVFPQHSLTQKKALVLWNP